MSKEKIKVFTGSGSFNPGEDLQQFGWTDRLRQEVLSIFDPKLPA